MLLQTYQSAITFRDFSCFFHSLGVQVFIYPMAVTTPLLNPSSKVFCLASLWNIGHWSIASLIWWGYYSVHCMPQISNICLYIHQKRLIFLIKYSQEQPHWKMLVYILLILKRWLEGRNISAFQKYYLNWQYYLKQQVQKTKTKMKFSFTSTALTVTSSCILRLCIFWILQLPPAVCYFF